MKSQQPPLKIGTPCPKRWEEMSGDGKRRYCEHCQLHVHNLSAMTRGERERFVAESGGQACIAYELRTDGSMVSPPTPWQRARWIGTAMLATLFPFLFQACATRRTPMLGRKAANHHAECKVDPTVETHTVVGTPMPTEPPKARH